MFDFSRERKFWKFFQSQISVVDDYAHSADKQKIIGEKLNHYFPGLGLGVLFTYEDEKMKSEFYVTAYADKTKFSSIRSLVEKSPKNRQYEVVAFAPPSILQDVLAYDNRSISTEDIKFICKKNENEVDLALFFPVKPSKSDTQFQYALQALLLDFLGEFQFSKIGIVDILSIDEIESKQQVGHLKHLYRTMAEEIK